MTLTTTTHTKLTKPSPGHGTKTQTTPCIHCSNEHLGTVPTTQLLARPVRVQWCPPTFYNANTIAQNGPKVSLVCLPTLPIYLQSGLRPSMPRWHLGRFQTSPSRPTHHKPIRRTPKASIPTAPRFAQPPINVASLVTSGTRPMVSSRRRLTMVLYQ